MSEEFEPVGEPGVEAREPRALSTEFGKLPGAERVLAFAALAVLLGFLFRRGWSEFGTRWYLTLGLFGSCGALLLIAMKLFGVRLFRPSLDSRILVVCALLPALGYVVDQFRPLGGPITSGKTS
ncbi:MAG: hypothetical protein ACE5JG_01820, partial [Planctomycetota bacterium]